MEADAGAGDVARPMGIAAQGVGAFQHEGLQAGIAQRAIGADDRHLRAMMALENEVNDVHHSKVFSK
jgi:hypothetical protein